jgi:hypothetical protein
MNIPQGDRSRGNLNAILGELMGGATGCSTVGIGLGVAGVAAAAGGSAAGGGSSRLREKLGR